MPAMLRKPLLLLATALLALPLLAANLGLYKDWASTPEAYFLTSAERAEWATLQTEADATAFIQKFEAARGGAKFKAELSKRVAMADKYLTIGNTPGSQTTRGKVVILLGPPKSMDVAMKQTKAARTGTSSMSVSAGGGDSRMSADDMAEVNAREGMGADSGIKIYTFTFAGVSQPVPVEVNAANGKDRIRDKKLQAELEKAYEEAAKASIVVK
jgi:GWxTD domain-containing protein